MRDMRAKYGDWALITGASDGIGREFARELAARGFDVALVARREARLCELAQELEHAHGVATRVIVADLTDPAQITRVHERVEDLDVGMLVASAGFGTSGDFVENPLSAELGMIDVNCRAVAAMSHHFSNLFVARGRGALVLLSSLVGFQGVARAANYAATKAYVQSLAEGLRVELRPHGVDVIACAPGPVASGFAARADMMMSGAATPDVVASGTLAQLGRRTTSRPGALSKLLEYALKMLPRWGRVLAMSKVMGGMTEHQASARHAS